MDNYKCDLCDTEYVGFISRHLHQRIDEHRFSAIGKHLTITKSTSSATLRVTIPSLRNAAEN